MVHEVYLWFISFHYKSLLVNIRLFNVIWGSRSRDKLLSTGCIPQEQVSNCEGDLLSAAWHLTDMVEFLDCVFIKYLLISFAYIKVLECELWNPVLSESILISYIDYFAQKHNP